MGLFRCRGCEARDKEIQHLLAELTAQRNHTESVARQLCEIVSPGSAQRSQTKPPTKPAQVIRPPAQIPRPTFPGYERGSDPPHEKPEIA